MKADALTAVPPRVVTVIWPVEPVPTMAVIRVTESTVKLRAFVPPNMTAVAPAKSVPVMVTCVPGGPDVGVKPVMTGAMASYV